MKLKRSNYYNIWFTADWHMGHNRPFIYEYRGFSNIKEHDDFIIDTYNSLVEKDDLVFHMGDVTMNKSFDLNRLNNSNRYFIRGNHDRSIVNPSLGYMADIKIDDQPITLTHYSMLNWNKSHYGAWNICGHSHGALKESLPDHVVGKRLDVGVDVGIKFNSQFMFTYEEVERIMANKIKTEHH